VAAFGAVRLHHERFLRTDSYSPVSLDYFDRAPFKFNGKSERLMVVKYLR
jgi:hypothetical protein